MSRVLPGAAWVPAFAGTTKRWYSKGENVMRKLTLALMAACALLAACKDKPVEPMKPTVAQYAPAAATRI